MQAEYHGFGLTLQTKELKNKQSLEHAIQQVLSEATYGVSHVHAAMLDPGWSLLSCFAQKLGMDQIELALAMMSDGCNMLHLSMNNKVSLGAAAIRSSCMIVAGKCSESPDTSQEQITSSSTVSS